jgi:hypothetical protein
VFNPVALGSCLSQPNRIWVGIANVNSEVTMINSKCREHRERESKKKATNSVHHKWFVVELSLRFNIFIIAKVSRTMGRGR